MNVELVKQYAFEAAHTTTWHGERRLHGHSYLAEIIAAGPIDDHFGWLVDYGEITAKFGPLYKQLDHYLLDEVPGMNDVSVEGVRAWIVERLRPELPQLTDVRVRVVGSCAFAPTNLAGARIRFGFEAAHYLPRLPEDHKCRRMHGHSFSVEVALADHDNADALLRDVYHMLDHRCLNDIEGLENPTSEHVSGWIWEFLHDRGATLSAVSVAETCTARCEYYGS